MSTARALARRWAHVAQRARRRWQRRQAIPCVGKGLAALSMSDTPPKRQKVQDGPLATENAGQKPTSERQDDCALGWTDGWIHRSAHRSELLYITQGQYYCIIPD